MWFKKIIENGWPCKKGSQVEIQDPSDELEVLARLRADLYRAQIRVDLLPKGNGRVDRGVDVIVREVGTDAVLYHLAAVS